MAARKTLIIDPGTGMAGDMFAAALISLGASAEEVAGVMERAGSRIGKASVRAEKAEPEQDSGFRLAIELEKNDEHLPSGVAKRLLEQCLQEENIAKPYAEFARRALQILIEAEREAHSLGNLDAGNLEITAVGIAHTPYKTKAPYQAKKTDGADFYIQIFPEFAEGIWQLDTFSHIYILSYLHRSQGYSLSVTPPWQSQEGRKSVGLFASRSPNRPSPVGLTLTKLREIKGARIYTGPLDIFDATPVIDIKPHIKSIDDQQMGNDGWIKDREHLRQHKEGLPHQHSAEEAVLHEAQDILLDIMGAAKGLELLNVDLEHIVCLTPVSVGGGAVRFSHGTLPVPAPAVNAILKNHFIPHVSGPVMTELLTPTGAALLAALNPRWQAREIPVAGIKRSGLGLGGKIFEPLNGLKIFLTA